jgi:hypothetical protein
MSEKALLAGEVVQDMPTFRPLISFDFGRSIGLRAYFLIQSGVTLI